MESFVLGRGGACAIRLLNWNTCIVMFGEKNVDFIFSYFSVKSTSHDFFFLLIFTLYLPCVYLKVDKYSVNFCLAIW